jgi:CHAD domain-containing protein
MARHLPDRLLSPRLAALMTAVPAACTGAEEGIHQARVASRRLREVVPVVSGPGEREARRAVRRVTRALGPVRELDVSLRLYGAVALEPRMSVAADGALRRALAVQRSRALRLARAALTPARLARLQDAVTTLVHAAGPGPRARVLATIAARVARRATTLGRALAGAGTLYAPERLHAVRIAVKQLRYALEVAGEARLGATSAARRQLKSAQDLLGEAHDLHVLAMIVGEVEGRIVTRSRAAARDLRRLERELDRRCRLLHARFLARRAALGALAGALAAGGSGRAAA